LQQNQGQLSNRGRTKEFEQLTDDEAAQIEKIFGEVWTKLSRVGERFEGRARSLR
jgi:hypothetical protein